MGLRKLRLYAQNAKEFAGLDGAHAHATLQLDARDVQFQLFGRFQAAFRESRESDAILSSAQAAVDRLRIGRMARSRAAPAKPVGSQ